MGNVKDITIDGGLQFKIGDEGFGYGKAVITDRDSYRHEIKADMKTKDEFLFSYNDTLNGKFSSKTLKELYSLVEDIIKNPDDHFIELFGELIESFKNSPIGKVLDGDYLAILDTELMSVNLTSVKYPKEKTMELFDGNIDDFYRRRLENGIWFDKN